MRDIRFLLRPEYINSRALIIGIDNYKHVSPLSYAVSDAEGVKQVLETQLGFPPENTVYLTNENATKQIILKEFIGLTNSTLPLDERVFVFFAGHGHTRPGIRGEVGYLVPYDGHTNDYSTLIRWDELTRNADLVRAKHMLFIMDACYGGLALIRNLQPGSARFLKDMMLRYSRQVLTAGKADEVVADSGGPLPNHSVFTGHLIEGMRGAAETPEGIITASSLMAYVYQKVASDKDSNQTPHYGHFDGDGDFILRMPILNETDEEGHDTDQLIVIPYPEQSDSPLSTREKFDTVKSLIGNEASTIQLHDFIVEELRHLLADTEDDRFPLNQAFSNEELLDRISRYEKSTWDLCGLLASLAYWAKPSHKVILQKAIARSTDRLDEETGIQIWLSLRYYPIILELYSSGIAAVEGSRYDCLNEIFFTKIPATRFHNKEQYFAELVTDGIIEIARRETFKRVPGHERHYTPLSEYLFKLLQPMLDDILFIGKSYERSFDEFEILFGLTVADIKKQKQDFVWGPIGRFGWKQHNYTEPPFSKLVAEARQLEGRWLPLLAGLFGGDYGRFLAVAEDFQKELNDRSYR